MNVLRTTHDALMSLSGLHMFLDILVRWSIDGSPARPTLVNWLAPGWSMMQGTGGRCTNT